MKQTDLRFIERQLQRLEEDAPPMPTKEEIFAGLVRVEKLWTPHEYAYIQHFHKVYGFDEQSNWLRGEIAYDEWMYWHLIAVQRYNMSAHELTKHLASLPTSRPHVWCFESMCDPAESRARSKKWEACRPWGNNVPYDVPNMQARGWHLVTVLMKQGIIWQLPAPFPHSLFAFMQDDPDVIILFDGPGSYEKLNYYLDHREEIGKKHKVREIEGPLEHTVFVPDRGYSYRWEDGSLLPSGHIAQLSARRVQRLQLGERSVREEA